MRLDAGLTDWSENQLCPQILLVSRARRYWNITSGNFSHVFVCHWNAIRWHFVTFAWCFVMSACNHRTYHFLYERRHSYGCSSYLLSKQRTAREEKGPHDQGNHPIFAVMSSESDVLWLMPVTWLTKAIWLAVPKSWHSWAESHKNLAIVTRRSFFPSAPAHAPPP